MRDYINPIFDLLNYNIFVLGDAKITPLSLLYLIFFSILLVFLSRKLKDLLIAKLLERTSLARGARQAVGTISRYVILLVGFVVILQTLGIDLTTFNVLAGAVGIGIGLGLQNIANNFISGLILLLERPIAVGDRIEVGSVNGEVVSMGSRSARIRTNDNITIIVPNSKFVTENVVNWSYESEKIRFRIPVAVAFDSDIELVTKLLVDAANENKDIALTPPPSVRCINFNADGLFLELRAWSQVRLHRPGIFKSDLNFAILEKFRHHNIEPAVPTFEDRRPALKSEPQTLENGRPKLADSTKRAA